MFGKADPYVLVQLGDQRIKSKTVKKTEKSPKIAKTNKNFPLGRKQPKSRLGFHGKYEFQWRFQATACN